MLYIHMRLYDHVVARVGNRNERILPLRLLPSRFKFSTLIFSSPRILQQRNSMAYPGKKHNLQ